MSTIFLKRASLALAVLAPASALCAQAYPDRPIRLIVPSGPGGTNDIMGRLAAMQLTERLGQQVIVDNRPGATGIIGMQLAAKAPADGYTLVLGNFSTLAVNLSLHRSLPYGTKALAIVTMLVSFGLSITFFVRPGWLKVVLAIFALGLATWLYRIPSRPRPVRD